MPSMQAILTNLVLYWRVKRGSRGKVNVERARRSLEKRARLAKLPPWLDRHEAVPADLSKGLCPAEWLSCGAASKTIVYFHGGGYFFCSLNTHRPICTYLAREAKAQVLSVDYRLAPEHPFPAAVNDALAWWRHLLSQGVDPATVAFAGDSAGGGLLMACMLAAKDEGLPMPAAAVLFSPLLDLTCSGDSMTSCRYTDVMFNRDSIPQAAEIYLGGQATGQPLASPLFGDLSDLPPLHIQASRHEILLSDSTRLNERMQSSGRLSELHLTSWMPHAWQTMVFLPEARRSLRDAGEFISKYVRAHA
jgi:epsilon-lactone hydrolase